MKKIIAVVIAAVMLALSFSGCSSDDIALYSATQRMPESGVYTETVTFDVSLEEPIVNEPIAGSYNNAGANYFINTVSKLLSLPEIACIATKSGDDIRYDISVSCPDQVSKYTLWANVNPENPMAAKYTMLIPSYIRPYLPKNIEDKKYLTFSMQDYMELIGNLNESEGADVGVIGGADGPTAIYVAPTASQMMNNEALINQAAQLLDVELVSGVERSGSNTVYTVKIDSNSLTKIVDGVIKSLSKEELGNIVGMIALMSGNVDSRSEITRQFREGVAYADTVDELICAKLAATGLLDKGLTVKYTVDREGYVVKTETDMQLDIDLAKLYNAMLEIEAELSGQEVNDMGESIKGRIKLGTKCVTEVTRINEKLDAMLPTLTESNNISIAKDISDYVKFSMAEQEWNNMWHIYDDEYEYLETLEEGQKLVLRNNENGREVTLEPKNIDWDLCV